MEDVEGATLATAAPGPFLHNNVGATLEKHSIKPTKVEFVDVVSSSDAFAAFDTGKVVATPASFDFVRTADKNPKSTSWQASRTSSHSTCGYRSTRPTSC